LCGNPGCCRPAHLHRESRSINISRRGCTGWLVVLYNFNEDSQDQKYNYVKICTHSPTCVTFKCSKSEDLDQTGPDFTNA
jgi:hypothetical protein